MKKLSAKIYTDEGGPYGFEGPGDLQVEVAKLEVLTEAAVFEKEAAIVRSQKAEAELAVLLEESKVRPPQTSNLTADELFIIHVRRQFSQLNLYLRFIHFEQGYQVGVYEPVSIDRSPKTKWLGDSSPWCQLEVDAWKHAAVIGQRLVDARAEWDKEKEEKNAKP